MTSSRTHNENELVVLIHTSSSHCPTLFNRNSSNKFDSKVLAEKAKQKFIQNKGAQDLQKLRTIIQKLEKQKSIKNKETLTKVLFFLTLCGLFGFFDKRKSHLYEEKSILGSSTCSDLFNNTLSCIATNSTIPSLDSECIKLLCDDSVSPGYIVGMISIVTLGMWLLIARFCSCGYYQTKLTSDEIDLLKKYQCYIPDSTKWQCDKLPFIKEIYAAFGNAIAARFDREVQQAMATKKNKNNILRATFISGARDINSPVYELFNTPGLSEKKLCKEIFSLCELGNEPKELLDQIILSI